jgi:hypothetical protein
LLDAIEQEAEQIEHRLKEKCQQAKLNRHAKKYRIPRTSLGRMHELRSSERQ